MDKDGSPSLMARQGQRVTNGRSEDVETLPAQQPMEEELGSVKRRGLAETTGWGLGFWLPLAILVAVTIGMAVTTMVGVWVGILQMAITIVLAGGGLIIAAMCCLLCYQCYRRSVREIAPDGLQSETGNRSEHNITMTGTSRGNGNSSRRGSYIGSPLVHTAAAHRHMDQGNV